MNKDSTFDDNATHINQNQFKLYISNEDNTLNKSTKEENNKIYYNNYNNYNNFEKDMNITLKITNVNNGDNINNIKKVNSISKVLCNSPNSPNENYHVLNKNLSPKILKTQQTCKQIILNDMNDSLMLSDEDYEQKVYSDHVSDNRNNSKYNNVRNKNNINNIQYNINININNNKPQIHQYLKSRPFKNENNLLDNNINNDNNINIKSIIKKRTISPPKVRKSFQSNNNLDFFPISNSICINEADISQSQKEYKNSIQYIILINFRQKAKKYFRKVINLRKAMNEMRNHDTKLMSEVRDYLLILLG